MFNILYEDNHIIVCVKPVNVPVQEDSTRDPDMLTILKNYVRDKYNKPGNVYIGLVHRLDRPVGGTMVFARTSKAASRLSEEIRNHTFHKTYYAIIKGRPENGTGELRDFLYKDEDKNMVRVVDESFPGAREAILSYKIIKTAGGFSLAEINLITGRPHQIRVQFSSRGHSLAGDKKYGTPDTVENIALWSHILSFRHPTRDEIMRFTSLPMDEYPWNIFKEDYSIGKL